MNYTSRPARFQHNLYEGFWVTLYLIFDGERTYTFFNESDMIDNYLMMTESGIIAYSFIKEVICSPTSLPELYKRVKEDVSKPDFNKKC